MQLQLSMAVADTLHEALLVRGESLDVVEAACLLMASASCPPSLCRQVVETLVRNDHRFCFVDSSSSHDLSKAGQSTCERVSLRHWEMPDPDLADVPFVALDLETTGSRPGTSKITEIGAVRYEGFREVGHFHTLVNPMRPIPPMITQITGITQEMVADAPRIDEVIPDLLEFLKGAIVVAHNACFDVGFLNYELRRLKGRQLGEGAIDTLPLSRARHCRGSSGSSGDRLPQGSGRRPGRRPRVRNPRGKASRARIHTPERSPCLLESPLA
jgi:DNA polymerase III epsilon subunit-like protein